MHLTFTENFLKIKRFCYYIYYISSKEKSPREKLCLKYIQLT